MPDSISKPNGASAKVNSSETVAYAGDGLSKEERDIVFASQGLSAGLFSERQLKSSLTNWTIHGETLLADHLQAAGLLTSRDREHLETATAAVLSDLHQQETSGGKSTLGSTLQRLDETGRIARLLGISGGGGLSPGGARSALDRLTLIRKLGQGGLGTVWLARDENLQRYVALKEVTRNDDASAPALARFRREAEITGRLEHPGIVPVYGCGEDRETQRVYYTMRFLGKQTLQNAVAEYHERRESGDHDPMLLRSLLTAFVSICQAIGHAHSRKVIHRDLKPENVAIDSFGQVIVIDWGLAKVLDETHATEEHGDTSGASDADSQMTAAGHVLGTPLYMAPEQAAGRVDEIDERTDIYGLGAILFAILTGIAPHERSQAESSDSGARGLFTAIAGKPTPLARQTNPDADPALEAICAKAMAKRRYARYQSATELADEIQHWMAGEPVRAYRETRMQRVGRWVQQHRRMSQALATILIVTLVAAVVLAASSYQNVVAARKARLEEMKGTVREIDGQFAASFEHLTKNVRFMSNVPPVQGIIVARSPAPHSAAESEETWRPRLELIYEGLLRANREYLAVSYLSAEKGSLQEIVRVERQTSDPSFIRRVPKSRLAQRQSDAFLEEIRGLSPGEVRLRVAEASSVDGHPRVVGAVPVYDEGKGNVFGMVLVETDAAVDAERILRLNMSGQAEMFITNAGGNVWASARAGRAVQIETAGTNVSDVVPGAQDFFDPGNVESMPVRPEHGVVARRIRLNSFDTVGSIWIILRAAE